MPPVVYFSLLIVLQVATSDPISPKCRGPPFEVKNPEVCCNLPQVFKEEDFTECDVTVPFSNNKYKTGSPDCAQQKCLLKKYNLMKDENAVDKDAVIKFMDKWIEENANFKEAIEKAKEICVKNNHPPNTRLCEPTEMFFCISSVLFCKCPKWEDTDDCTKVKNFVEECYKDFMK